jgi:acyl-homoserine-lactone acylase
LINPHFPWTSESRFYQMHLVIPNKLNVMGASIGGLPVVVMGFNWNLAWTHTSDASMHFTLFYLQIDPADPTRYIVDGQSRAMVKKTLSVEADNGIVTRDYYFTEHGPVIGKLLNIDLAWTNQEAYAFHDANFDNDRLAEQWWALDKAKSIAEFKGRIESIMGIPWVNTLATDKSGNVYFTDVTPVPNVSPAKAANCVPLLFQVLLQSLPLKGLYILSGDNSACNWDDDPTAPQKGIFPASMLPTLLRTDYVQNSNDSAWMTNPSQPMVGFPSNVSTDSSALNGRTRYALSQITARLNGSDGLPGNKFNIGSLQSFAFSNRSFFASVLLPDLKSACGSGGIVLLNDGSAIDIGKGCAVLNGWDGKAELTSVGWPLFEAWRLAMVASGVDYWAVAFDANDPVNTPRGLRLTDPVVFFTARQMLAQAMKTLDDKGLDYTKPWGQLQVAVRGDKRIPIHGGGSTADIYNDIESSAIGDGQFNVFRGSSVIFTVSYDGNSPKAQGFLTYSQSTNPASPHYGDQTERFSAKKWISYPFTEEEITADPKLSVKELWQ